MQSETWNPNMTEKKPTAKPRKLGAGKAGARVKPGQAAGAVEHRRQKFIEAYIANGGNATDAAKVAGYSERTAYSQGQRLLKNVEVAQALADRRREASAKTGLTTERVLEEVARLALFDPRRLFNDDGSPKGIHELDDDTAAAIAGLEVLEEYKGQGKDREFVGYVRKYKVADKNAALEKAMKHLGLFEQDNKQRAGILGDLPREVVQAIQERLSGLAKR